MACCNQFLSAASLVTMLVLALAVDGHGQPEQDVHHLRLYMHEGSGGAKPSAVVVVNGSRPLLKSPDGADGTRFGDVRVVDDTLTEGPSPRSRALGRGQGFYVTASLSEPALLVSMNMVLTDGPYNGSTVTVAGRNHVMAPMRELSVVGGTGRFRMARGYALWRTASWRGNNAVLEINIFLHA